MLTISFKNQFIKTAFFCLVFVLNAGYAPGNSNKEGEQVFVIHAPIRDRNAEKLSTAPHRPDKTPTWEGDPELQKFNAIMRDELDNTQELIDLLEDGGMKFISHADDSKYEDIFLLGPDLIEQLKLKRKIMLDHWTDIEGYMATPFK